MSAAALAFQETIAACDSVERSIDEQRKAAWLLERRKHITGTDIAAIFGLNRWTSPIEVYLSKKGALPPKVDNDPMEFGRRFERPILEVYSERLGVPIEFADHWTLYPVPGFPLLGASLDARWLTGDRRPVDAKNTRFKTDKWGDTGSDVFPIYYQLQLAVQMMACDEPDISYVTPASDLAVCFGGNEFARYTLHRDVETDAAIKERAAEWWDKHIVHDTPPEPDGSESYGEFLKARFKRAAEITVPSTAEVRQWVEARAEAKARMATAESDANVAEQAIKAYMGNASAIPGVCTWKNNKDSEATDWRAVTNELAQLVDGDKVAAIITANTQLKPGPRVFRMSSK